MNKSLNNLSTAELGQLFPIQIVPYDRQWNEMFLQEKKEIERILTTDLAIQVEHFGSTAIPDLASKPTIDILVEIPSVKEIKPVIVGKMITGGYQFIPRQDCPPPYLMFLKGYTLEGYKGQCYHLHMAPRNHIGLWERLYFRDYLNLHPEVARAYEALKLELASKYRNDREKYTEGKSEFIYKITEIAKKEKKETG